MHPDDLHNRGTDRLAEAVQHAAPDPLAFPFPDDGKPISAGAFCTALNAYLHAGRDMADVAHFIGEYLGRVRDIRPDGLVVLQPPPLTDADYERIDEGVLPVRMAERRIVWNLIEFLDRAGFVPNNVDLGDQMEPTPTPESMMEHAFSVDDCYMHFAPKSGAGGGYWVRPVFGNGGWDVIADYSMHRESSNKLTYNDLAWDAAMLAFGKVSSRFI